MKKSSLIYVSIKEISGESNTLFILSTVHSYSLYNLSIEEEKTLLFGLDQYIPTTLNSNNLHTKVEYSYENITNDISHLSEDVVKLKTKLCHACEKYSDIKVLYKYQRTIDTLRQNNNIVVLKQDKGQTVVILYMNIYVDKFLSILDTNQLMKLHKSPTSSYESKIQRTLRRIKLRLSTEGDTGSFVQLVPMLVDFMGLQRYITLIEMIKLINSFYAQQYPAQQQINLLNILPNYCHH